MTDTNITNKSINGYFSTRYRGSKNKIVNWIWEQIKDLDFTTFLDAFGGTGCVSYKAKLEGKEVTYNDYLKFNYYIGLALIENNQEKLSKDDIDYLFSKHENIQYGTFIFDTFKETYFTDEENIWIDNIIANIQAMENEYKKALAYYCLFQSCIIKRPYNLFHRKNLYVRFNDVERNFGNKTTWDTPFETHFLKFAEEVNNCIFSNNKKNKALNMNVFDLPTNYDLVYIDTPYIPKNGEIVDYRDAYHFLEGLTDYTNWDQKIDKKRKHYPLKKETSIWNNKKTITTGFYKLVKKFKDSIIVISYREDGIPSSEQIMSILKEHKDNVMEIKGIDFKYVLSKNETKELLFVAY